MNKISTAILLFSVSLVASACNLSDPLDDEPPATTTEGCEGNDDCNGNGECDIDDDDEVGVCQCDEGYEGDDCGDCAEGFVEMGDDCVAETNNINNATDPCAEAPCGDGTCTPTEEGGHSCECPDGTTGESCPDPEGCDETNCDNGTCDAEGTCVCETGYAGPTCETCAEGFEGEECDTCVEGAFGPECLTCAQISEGVEWADTAFAIRRPVVVFNPADSTLPVLDDVVAATTFAHSLLVTAGAGEVGEDLRVFDLGGEIPRVLGFDSEWNALDTTVFFPTTNEIPPGEFDLYFLYALNSSASLPNPDLTEIFAQDRGWFYTTDGQPIYSHDARSNGLFSIQMRQRGPRRVQFHFYDASDDQDAVAFVQYATGGTMETINFDTAQGSVSNPHTETVEISDLEDEVTVLMRVRSLDDGSIFLADNEVQNGVDIRHQVELSRTTEASAPPNVATCPPEMRP